MSCTHGDKGQAVGFCVAEYAIVAGSWPNFLTFYFLPVLYHVVTDSVALHCLHVPMYPF